MEKKNGLQYGIAIPQMFPGGEVDPTVISKHLATVEALGYHSVWVQERLIGGLPALDAMTLLTYAAALTSRLRLGTSVLLTALRSPIPLAKCLASLDQLSRGRLIVGVGLGGFADSYPAFGISPRGRARRFEEGVRLMKRLWTEERVSSQDRFRQMDGLSPNSKPYQEPHPPLWFGAHAESALRRAVKLGNGWMGAGSSTTVTFKEELKTLRRLLGEEGRDPAGFSISKRVYVAVDRDKAGATRKMREWFGQYYGNADMATEVSVRGSEEECVEGLGEVVSEGIDLLMLNPLYDMTEQAQRLAEDVLPKL